MTDTCATCVSYKADPSGNGTGVCRLGPPTSSSWHNPVSADMWCSEFALTTSGATGSITSIAVAMNATAVIYFVAKSDGTLWAFNSLSSSWTQITSP